MVLLFLLLALSVSIVYLFMTHAVFWKVILLFFGSFLAINVLYMLFWAIVGLFVDTKKPIDKPSRLCMYGCVGISSLGLGYCLVKNRSFGLEKLPGEGRFLLVCNHRSLFDPLILVKELSKYDVAFISKPENIELPVVGKIGYGAGCLPLDRENNRNALKAIVTATDYLKKGFCSMAIFPEGTRNKTDEVLLPFHPGSFKLAQKAGVPIVIACLKNTRSVKKNMFRHVTHTQLHILEVLSADTVSNTSTRELANYSSDLIKEELGI